jgi:hypothetical protein
VTRRIAAAGPKAGDMAEDGEAGQLELLPATAPETQRARLPLAELVGFQHARPRRELVESIARLGLLQPVVVAKRGGARYAVYFP